ncbi:MAG: UvrD-helicase domain-containing protein [Deltaproteobacteria bacterium]|nr:UvrD-helicase domain-containing protein [Deltaproteobacteria bacterium]
MIDLSTLNPPQREAVTTTEGPLLVLAGAGSGKTRVIAHRVAWLLQKGVEPSAILCVTFTNKAAREMRERVVALAGALGGDVFVSTFHAFGLWLLRQEHKAAGLPRRFAICDDGDQLSLVKRALREFDVEGRAFDAQKLLAMISRAKAAGQDGIAVRPEGQGDDYDLVAAEVLPRYQQALLAQRAVDFDDLISRPVALLRGDAAVRKRSQQRFHYLLVDEYQDTNLAQLELLKLVAGKPMNVCAVGDDDQAIYGWRGAEVKNILRFERHFPGAKEVRLEQNYRSTGHILACANGVIAPNPDRRPKKLWTAAGDGDPVEVADLADEEEEARFVASAMSRLRGEGRPWSHFAVLYRLNAQSGPFEEALREAGIPHRVHGAPAFFDRAEVRDLLAYLKVCAEPRDDVSLARIVNVPARGIGDTSLGRLQDFAAREGLPLGKAVVRAAEAPGMPAGAAARLGELSGLLSRYRAAFSAGRLAETARRLVEEVDLYSHARQGARSPEAGNRRVEAIDGLIRSLERWEERTGKKPTLGNWLAKLALDSREEEEVADEGVSLMSLHAAKGLEFPVVFLVGLEEELLPVAGMKGEARDLAEERRLAYVGITRARERLFLTRARVRVKRGKAIPRTPSRFLGDLPAGAHALHDPAKADRPEDVASRSAEVLAALRARLAGPGR